MPKRSTPPDYCAIARALDLLGEWWTILIVRDAFLGVRHFDEFLRNLGIARNVLTARLNKLVAGGVLERRPSREDRRRVEYRLTDKGRELFPIIVALAQWGNKWLRAPGEPAPFAIVDRGTGQPVAPVEVRSQDGRSLRAKDTMIVEEAGITDEIRRMVPALRAASGGSGP